MPDSRSLELVEAAGYDGREAVGVFNILKDVMIDYGDLDGVFGASDEPDDAQTP